MGALTKCKIGSGQAGVILGTAALHSRRLAAVSTPCPLLPFTLPPLAVVGTAAGLLAARFFTTITRRPAKGFIANVSTS